jgi:methionyl-tRNA formyltransferase
MNYIFFGTPDFAAIILEKLIGAGLPPALLVCNPDRPVGRKKVITPPQAKIVAEKHGIGIYQPEKLEIRNLKLEIGEADFAIVASYAKIIPKNILELFPKGIIGVHPSLLPKYRGPTPIQSVILNGEAETGVTLYLLDEKVDHGPIIAQRALENNDLRTINYVKLHDALANLGADLLIETLPKFIEGKIKPVAQNEAEATFTKKFENRDGYVDLEKDDPVIIEKKVRALNPEPGVWTIITAETASLIRANKKIIGKRMKILEAEVIDSKLKLKKIQFEGKKPQILTNKYRVV